MKKILLTFIICLLPLLGIMAADPVSVTLSTDTIDTSGPLIIKIANKGSGSYVTLKFNIIKPDGKIYRSVSDYFYSDRTALKFSFLFDKYDLNGYYKITNFVYYNENTGDSIKPAIETGFYVINTTPDKTPPVIKNFSVSKNSAVPGDTVAISFDAQDSLSGLQNYDLAILNTKAAKAGSLSGAKSSKIKYNYIVGQYERLGARKIEINLYDQKQNTKKFTNNDLSFNINITGTTPDTVGPEIQAIYSSNSGDSVYLNIYAKDDFSGIVKLSCDLYNSSQSKVLSPVLTKSNDSLYVCNITSIVPYIQTGNYTVKAIASDKNNNTTYLDYVTSIINQKFSDNTSPIITASLDKDTVFANEEITLKVKVTDDISGIREIYGAFMDPQSKTFSFQTNTFRSGVKDTTVYIKLNLPKYGVPGAWNVYYVLAQDNVGNYDYIMNLGFAYFPPSNDTKPPVIEKLSFSPRYVNAGDTVIATVIANDLESGISSISINNYGTTYNLDMVSEEKFQVAIPTSKFAYSEDKGEWNINISDLAGNTVAKTDTSTYTIISKQKLDFEPPVLDSISIYPAIAKLTDTIKVKVYAHDDFPGMAGVSMRFTSEEGFNLSFALTKKTSNEFEYKINPGVLVPGLYNSGYFYAYDSAQNDISVASDCSFEVLGTKVTDTETPKFISIKGTPSKVKPGEKVEIELKTSDNTSIYTVLARLIDLNGPHTTVLSNWNITKSNDTFTCITTYVVPEYTYNGTWIVNAMQIEDAYYNYFYTSSQSYNIFEVVDGKTRPNRAPSWVVSDQSFTIKAGKVFAYNIPFYGVGDPDNDQLTITPTLNGASLPSWITFTNNPMSVTFKPTNQNVGDNVVYLVASDPSGLKDTLAIKAKINFATEVNSIQNEECKIYPNPAKDYVTIQTSDKVNEVFVYDMIGKVKLQSTSYNDKIDVSALKRGFYVMQILTDKGTYTEKLIIK
jgi:hypothetical protein